MSDKKDAIPVWFIDDYMDKLAEDIVRNWNDAEVKEDLERAYMHIGLLMQRWHERHADGSQEPIHAYIERNGEMELGLICPNCRREVKLFQLACECGQLLHWRKER